MAVSRTPSLPQLPQSWKAQILPADTTTLKTVVTGGANGTKVVAVIVSSSDTAAQSVQLGITRAGVFYPLCTVSVPITAGQVSGAPPVNMLAPENCPGLPVDNDGQVYMLLSSPADAVQVKSLVTVTAAKEIDVNSFGADF